MSGKYTKLLIFWGVLFVLSLYFIFTGLGTSFQTGMELANGLDKPIFAPEEAEKPGENTFNWGMALALLTAVASGGGFVTTTYFSIRADRREAALHQLVIHSLEQEIEHKDLQINKLRRERELAVPS